MKKLNIFAMEMKGLDQTDRVSIFRNLRECHYQWPDGMFHRIITNKIGLNFKYNNVSKLKDLKQFSDDNKPYVLFVKFYEFRQIVGRIENNNKDSKL